MTRLDRIRARLEWRLWPDRMLAEAQPTPDPNLEAVYLKRGIVLIHIPKNAGTSVEDALYGYRVRHRTWRELRASCPRAWATLPKVAILREPVERFLSAYDYLRAGGRNRLDRTFGMLLVGDDPIDALTARMTTDASFRRHAMSYFHFRPQSDFVCDDGKPVVDHLIPKPRMAAELQRVAGLPPGALEHKNRSTGPRTSRAALSDGVIDRIRTLYRADGELYDDACAAPPDIRAAEVRADPTSRPQ
ncbi:hypothetical protein [uncultured Jannaschia sp.]|uniref:hypothetical protein n=1 Tax=uncultured Jannaschia sp. TaxID=293347 RepID=UPI002611F402|nr:hypothetical protein [uncultured Jannaschia sp.]